MKKTQQPKQTESTPAAAPDWVNKTPPDHCYSLDMYENSDYSTESVALARTEYITLKQYVAGLRGIVPTVPEAPDVIQQTELRSVFDDLEIINLKILGYRRRILAGAAVEPGPLTTKWEGEEPGPESPRDDGWMNFNAYGLNICAAEASTAAA
jgi:hypothetical protein